ncbi:hypothetical protein MF408_22205 [Nocardioides sp. TF02-7]|nr:hypothetical protein MF408_22205 [Nocardioides sp. TF02-7]
MPALEVEAVAVEELRLRLTDDLLEARLDEGRPGRRRRRGPGGGCRAAARAHRAAPGPRAGRRGPARRRDGRCPGVPAPAGRGDRP